MKTIATWFMIGMIWYVGPSVATAQAPDATCTKVEDFEQTSVGTVPRNWVYLNERRLKPLSSEFMHPNKRFAVAGTDANKFVRAYTEAESQHIMIRFNDESGRPWLLEAHPVLSWRWRMRTAPSGTSEEDKNDTGAAVYVTFDRTDWLGRPHSIKYSYSSTLPIGSTISSGNVKVFVISSAADPVGDWISSSRDVASDYRMLFKDDPPQPALITLWSDSDDTRTISEADFDDIALCETERAN